MIQQGIQRSFNHLRPTTTTISSSHGYLVQAMRTWASTAGHHDLRVAPSARNLIALRKLDPNSIKGTGRRGLILKEDVQNFLLGKAPSSSSTQQQQQQQQIPLPSFQIPLTSTPVPRPAPFPLGVGSAGKFEDIPVTNIRRVIAERLTFSKTSMPHLYLSTEIDLDKVLQARASFNALGGAKVSVNDFFIKAAALSLLQVKEANASYHDGFVRQHNCVDVSVAVATDRGLITPVVKNADKLGIAEISKEVQRLAVRAREAKLLPEEFQGGTFTISNLGMFGVTEFTAVINPPQACILAVGQGRQEVIVDEIVEEIETVSGEVSSESEEAEGTDLYSQLLDRNNPLHIPTISPRIKNVVTVSLSADERVVSHEIAGRFLETLRSHLADPQSLLL